MLRFRKKPVVIEAMRFYDRLAAPLDYQVALDDWLFANQVDCKCRYVGSTIVISTLEGDMVVNPGDWIIKGVHGELYPCKSDIFEATYDLVA